MNMYDKAKMVMEYNGADCEHSLAIIVMTKAMIHLLVWCIPWENRRHEISGPQKVAQWGWSSILPTRRWGMLMQYSSRSCSSTHRLVTHRVSDQPHILRHAYRLKWSTKNFAVSNNWHFTLQGWNGQGVDWDGECEWRRWKRVAQLSGESEWCRWKCKGERRRLRCAGEAWSWMAKVRGVFGWRPRPAVK